MSVVPFITHCHLLQDYAFLCIRRSNCFVPSACTELFSFELHLCSHDLRQEFLVLMCDLRGSAFYVSFLDYVGTQRCPEGDGATH